MSSMHCPPLQFNSSVSVLCLDGCKLGNAGGIQVAAMLQGNRTILQLSLANTDLDTDCIIAMATVLQGTINTLLFPLIGFFIVVNVHIICIAISPIAALLYLVRKCTGIIN